MPKSDNQPANRQTTSMVRTAGSGKQGKHGRMISELARLGRARRQNSQAYLTTVATHARPYRGCAAPSA